MGKIKASDKIMFKNQIKRRKYGNKNFLHKAPSKRLFGMEFTAFKGELTPEEALTSFTISDAYD